MKHANFDAIAPFYDSLAKWIFAGAIERAPLEFLDELPTVHHILIVGGGTGKLLPSLISRFPDVKITYIEPSANMMHRAKARCPQADILFIQQPLEEVKFDDGSYDMILTPFVLDLFNHKELGRHMGSLNSWLTKGGQWLHCDFYVDELSPWWQNVLLRCMYWFFGLTTGMKNKRLLDFNSYFHPMPLMQQRSKSYYGGMIKTFWYQKHRELEHSSVIPVPDFE